MITGIEHIAIAAADPARLAKWYVEVLGFAIVYNSGHTFFVKAPDGSMIEIILAEGRREYHTMKDPGLRHIALAAKDFFEVYEKLKAAGVKFITEPSDSKGVKVVFFEDPEGNYLHLIERQTPLG